MPAMAALMTTTVASEHGKQRRLHSVVSVHVKKVVLVAVLPLQALKQFDSCLSTDHHCAKLHDQIVVSDQSRTIFVQYIFIAAIQAQEM
jgi:hypothetical protein